MTDLTTRQIAERIARAVLLEVDGGQIALAPHHTYFNDNDLAAAVLRTLRENGVWLHRTVQDADGVIDGEAPSEVLPEVEA